MVRATVEDQEFEGEFQNQLRRRQAINRLMMVRGVKGLSQKGIADKLGCTQSRISKMESSDDHGITIGDLVKYAAAIDLSTVIMFMPKDAKAVDRVKFHAMQIKALVDGLAGLAENDSALAEGVKVFFGEAAYNLLRILQEAADKLPKTHPLPHEAGVTSRCVARMGPRATIRLPCTLPTRKEGKPRRMPYETCDLPMPTKGVSMAFTRGPEG